MCMLSGPTFSVRNSICKASCFMRNDCSLCLNFCVNVMIYGRYLSNKTENFLWVELFPGFSRLEPHDIPRGTDEGPRPLYFRFKRKQAPVSGWRGYQAWNGAVNSCFQTFGKGRLFKFKRIILISQWGKGEQARKLKKEGEIQRYILIHLTFYFFLFWLLRDEVKILQIISLKHQLKVTS